MLAWIALIILAWLLVQTTFFQNFIVGRVTKKLSKNLNTTVQIKHVDFDLFNYMLLEGTLIKDQRKDTLLYAGRATVNLTDWFFFSDSIELKYIGLKDAVVHMNRTDSVWNYQFLIDYFTSPTPEKKQQRDINLRLKQLDLDNISFVQKDGWRGENMTANLESLDLESEIFDLKNKRIKIKSLDIVKPYFAIYNYDGNPARKPRPPSDEEEFENDPDRLRWNPDGWNVSIAKFKIHDGSFSSDIETGNKPMPTFDGQHISFSSIDGDFENIQFIKDSLTAKVLLSTKERSGFIVKKLAANMRMHPEAMEFANLELRTNKSYLHDYFALRYNTFDDMAYFISRVRLEANFDKSELHSDDIAFFAPAMKDWKKDIEVTGTVKGTVESLNGKNLIIKAGTETYFNGDVSMAGLPDINKTYIDFVARDFKTVYRDAITIVPQLRDITQPRLDKIRFLNFKGNFTGFITDFVTYGTFTTNLGVITTDLNMKIPDRGISSYSGTLKTENFQLGQFIENDQFGKISLNGSIKGSGLNASTLNANMDGNISLFEYMDYPYKAITVKGSFTRKNFSGVFDIKDPNLVASLNGDIDFRGKLPVFKVTGMIEPTSLKMLNLSKDNIEFGGKFDLNFSGNNIDNFLGSARVYEASIYRNEISTGFDSLLIVSKIENGQRSIIAQSNEFDAALVGQFSLTDLPNSVQGFLHQYYPAYIKQVKVKPGNENFSFVVTTKNVSEYLKLFQDKVEGLNYSVISGSINTFENKLDLTASVPSMRVTNMDFTNVELNAKGNYDSLNLEAKVLNVAINDSLNFPDTYVRISSADDISDVVINTSANQALNAANLSAQVQTLSSGAKITFKESTFDLNGKTWTINKDGELVLTRELVSADNIRIYNGEQSIEVTTVPSDIGNTQDIRVDLTKLNIGDFTPFFLKDMRMEGMLTGAINIIDPFGKFQVDANTVAEQFRFENDSIGKVNLTSFYNARTGTINFGAKSENLDYIFDANGVFSMKDSTRAENLGIDIKLNETRISILEKYLTGVFSEIDGKATGNLKIQGPTNDLEYLGRVRMADGRLRVKFTNVVYTVPTAEFNFLEDRIDFGTFNLRDTLGNYGQVRNGKLFHRGFDDLGFDFTFNTNKLLVLSTENNGIDPFYGKVIAKANMTLKGPLDNMVMNIAGEPADSSSFTLTNKSGKESGIADFVVWKVYGREMEPVERSGEVNLAINLDVTANPLIEMFVIMDEVTGDVIQANGQGSLQIRANTNGDLSLTGRYDINRGNYNFSFESLLKKPFKLRENANNYIQWSGDPFNARINIDAEYEAENVKFSDLGLDNFGLMSGTANNNVRSYRGKMLVVANLTGELLKPDIKFSIEMPANSPIKNDPDVVEILRLLTIDENELNKQVAFLIVFNSFAPRTASGNQANIGGAAFEGIVVGSISGVLSNVLSKQFSNVLQDIFNDKSIRVNFNARLYSGSNFLTNVGGNNAFNIDRTNLNLSIAKSYLNDRLSFTFGSAVDFGLTSAQVNAAGNLPFLPDITAEWKITPDGRLLLTFFYRDSYNFLGGTGARQNRTGASISYRKDFERIWDLFLPRREKRKPE